MCHHILPPTFRALAQLFTLPHRRYYTPATDYTNVPADKGLRAFPSVLDLPGMVKLEADGVSTARNNNAFSTGRGQIKQRANGRGGLSPESEKPPVNGRAGSGAGGVDSELGGRKQPGVLHYDADGTRLLSIFPTS
jgi:dihydrosphingosine 1-phosphate phosphatase